MMMAEEAAEGPVGYDSHHRVVALDEKRVSRVLETPAHEER